MVTAIPHTQNQVVRDHTPFAFSSYVGLQIYSLIDRALMLESEQNQNLL